MRYTIHAALPQQGDVLRGQVDPWEHRHESLALAETWLAMALGGFGRYSVAGAWVNDEGVLLQEPGVCWEVFAPGTEVVQRQIEHFASEVRVILGQTEVIVVAMHTPYIQHVREGGSTTEWNT